MRALIYLFSLLPLSVLHLLSDVLYFFVYKIAGYRQAVVSQNLARSFPEKTPEWRLEIEKKFYRNFCDVMMETIKTTTISEAEFRKRCITTTAEKNKEWFKQGFNLDGITSHLANWEWLGLSTSLHLPFDSYCVYQPLSNERMDRFLVKSRARFGLKLIPMKSVRSFFKEPKTKPYMFGLLSDQSPKDYSKAYEVEFLNQKTFYSAGPGLLSVQYNLVPVWGWMKRVGRSRYEWGIELVNPDLSTPMNASELEQIARMANAHQVTLAAAESGYRIVKEYSRLLEVKIKMAPEDWLWSHRRWKSRS